MRDIAGNDFHDVKPERMAEIKRHIQSVSWRECMTRSDVKADIDSNIAILEDPPTDFFWESNGEFTKEAEGYEEIAADQRAYVELMERERPRGIPPRRTHLHQSHYQRKKYRAKNVKVGDFVAVDARRRAEYVPGTSQRFYLGTVRRINRNSGRCIVDWWHCRSGEFKKYTKFTSGTGEKCATVILKDILVRFDKLLTTGRIGRPVEKAIIKELELPSDRRDTQFIIDPDNGDDNSEIEVDELSEDPSEGEDENSGDDL